MKIVYCGELDACPYAPDHLGIKQGFAALEWDWYVVDPILGKPTGNEVAEKINAIFPEIVIHGNTISLTKQVCKYVKPDIVQVFWMLDYRTPQMLENEKIWSGWVENGAYLNSIFISSRDHVKLWEKEFGAETFFAPHACYIPPELEYSEEHEFDLVFIGGLESREPYAERSRFIRQIAEKSPVELKVVNEPELSKRNQVWKDMGKYYHSSKIVLDVSHFWDNWGYCSGRYWYTATLGGCAVTKRFPGCYQFFPDSFKWYFDTPQQAADMIQALLNNDEERTRTKRRVSRYAWRNHSYKIRFQQMMLCLETGKQVPMY